MLVLLLIICNQIGLSLSSYDPGITIFYVNKEEFHFKEYRSFYENSTLSITVECSGNKNFYYEYFFVNSLPCLPVTENSSSSTVQVPTLTRLIDCKKNETFEQTKKVENEGLYAIIISAKPDNDDQNTKAEFSAKFTIKMFGSGGYLSVIDWPLLPFYATMCVVYSLYAIVWLILCAIYWRDILRIQFWIGGVIALGMFEKAMFLGELDSIRRTGFTTEATIIVAEFISALKRTLARMLVIIACLGFGIVKPRLGEDLHKVTIVGSAFFIFSCIDGVSRTLKEKVDHSWSSNLVNMMLAVIDAVICFWILMSIIRTIRLLYMRKNIAKLTLYRHFRNTLIFGVIVSTGFLIWTFFTHTMTKCIKTWRALWFDEAVWHILFSSLLLVIIILWRPSSNNQRYAFSPVNDVDEEEIVQDANEALGNIKKKKKGKTNSAYNNEINNDEDLKWVDEHIPSSLLDVTLPSLLDSDEEIDRTRVEVSKLL